MARSIVSLPEEIYIEVLTSLKLTSGSSALKKMASIRHPHPVL
jgi:hypothetical protein